MAYGIHIRKDYCLVRMDYKTIPAKDIKLLKSAPQLRDALIEAIKLLKDSHPREAEDMQRVVNQANGKGDTNNYKAEGKSGPFEPDYIEEAEGDRP